MKYAVTLYHVANVKQTIYVDAETEEEAENKVFEGEMWDDGNWQYVGVDMDSYPEVSNIESLEDKMELTQAQIDFRNKLEELADRAGSALVLPDNSQMDAEAFLKAIDKSEVETILNELGVEKKSEEYKDGDHRLPIERKAEA